MHFFVKAIYKSGGVLYIQRVNFFFAIYEVDGKQQFSPSGRRTLDDDVVKESKIDRQTV